MDEEIVLQILDELFSSLEPLDTVTSALLQLLKAKGVATENEVAPFLEQAGNASSVRWRAARVRIAGLISSAMRSADRHPETQTPTVDERNSEAAAKAPKETGRKEAGGKETDQEDRSEPEAKSVQASQDNSESGETAETAREKVQDESRTNESEPPSTRAAQENVKREAA
jgi:cobalamin biosynthesis protein CobT